MSLKVSLLSRFWMVCKLVVMIMILFHDNASPLAREDQPAIPCRKHPPVLLRFPSCSPWKLPPPLSLASAAAPPPQRLRRWRHGRACDRVGKRWHVQRWRHRSYNIWSFFGGCFFLCKGQHWREEFQGLKHQEWAIFFWYKRTHFGVWLWVALR